MAAVAPASPAVSFASGHYHFSVEGVGRGKGAPVMAKAAYRSGECLFDERTGQFQDYRGHAERVVDTWVMARDDAPAWIQHAAREARQRAWNEAERAEPRANGRLATEIVVGLPHELTNAERKQLLSAFVLRIVEKYGVFADVSIHLAHDERNIHAHVLFSHRELGPDGFGDLANRRTVPKKVKGQWKQIGIAGIAATPDDIKGLREQWATDVNRAYERAGLPIRVDHRSFEDRGIKDVPTIHLGAKATAAERRGYCTDRGDINRIIEFGNAERRQLEDEKQRQDAEIIDLQKALIERLAQQPPRTDAAEKNYSKRQGDEITAEKAKPMQTPDSSPPANENRNPHHLEHPSANETNELEQFRLDTINPDPWNALPDMDFTRPEPPPEIAAEARQTPEVHRIVVESDEAARVTNAYLRECREAYHRYGFSSRDPEQTGAPINALTLPEPQNDVEQTALNHYLDAWQERTGKRPEVIFEPRPTRPEIAAEARHTPEPEAAPVTPEPATRTTDGPARAAQSENSGEIADEATRARVLASQNRDEEQADRMADAAFNKTLYELGDAAAATVHRAERVASGFFAGFANIFEGIISRLGEILASPFRPTELEREVAPKVLDERAQERADLAAYFDNEAARDRLLDGIRIDDAEQERQERLEGGRSHDYERD